MTIHKWTTCGTNIQGDLRVTLSSGRLYKDYIELYITAHSDKWDKCNVAIEYGLKKEDYWHSDMKMVASSVDFMNGNKLFGVKASKGGSLTKVFWRYKENDLFDASILKVKMSILPRVKHFSKSIQSAVVAELYQESRADLKGVSFKDSIIGINNEGKYIALINASIAVLDSLESATPLFSFDGVSGAKHVIQTYEGSYLVADTENDRVIRLNESLDSITSSYSVSKPQFIDYSEANDTVLVTSRDPDHIYELSWYLDLAPQLLWSSDYGLDAPSSATYSKMNLDNFIISDTNKHRIVIYEKLKNTYKDIDRGYVKNGESLKLFKPFRAYQFINGEICVVESRGQRITWGPSGYGWYVGSASVNQSFVT